MPDTPTENLPPDSLAARFVARVATRDVPVPPPPPAQTPEAVAARLAAWLRTAHGLRDERSRRAAVQMLLLLLAQPEASTATLGAAAGLSARGAARACTRLATLGLTQAYYRSRTRYHRLTRATEDALLPVVTGLGG